MKTTMRLRTPMRLLSAMAVAIVCALLLHASAYAGELRITVADDMPASSLEGQLEGSGTEGDPYLIKTADDYAIVRDVVNAGDPLEGVYLKQAADITLPKDWVPIGSTKNGQKTIQRGENLNAFSGVIDGGEFTLTIQRNGKPLIGYVKGAEVRNLNIFGERIAGAGLIGEMAGVGLEGTSVVLDGITLKSGSKTLQSGLVDSNTVDSPFAICSAGFRVTIRNCTVEEGVTVGYDRSYSQIGGIIGRLQGEIENCTCDATVQGGSFVGGIIGMRDNAMGEVSVSNCTFGGSVAATGQHAGGIAGGVYDNSSAPNGVRLGITGCRVTGSVAGADKVGGILGGDSYTAQAWNDYQLSGNRFAGTVEATKDGAGYVGGIIGFYRSLNCHDRISDNYFAAGCGAERGIGGVQYVDTSCTGHEAETGELYFSTEVDTSACPEVAGCAWLDGKNRADDPLGADAAALCYSDADVGDEDGVVFITIADEGKVVTSNGHVSDVVMSRVPVKLSDLAAVDLEAAGFGKYAWEDADGNPVDNTVLKLFLYVLDTYHASGYGNLKVSGEPGRLYIEDGFWGHNFNFTYYLNGEYPMGADGQGATADRIRLTAGDWVDVAMFSDLDFWWQPFGGHHYFLDPATGAAAGRLSAVVGQPATFTVARTAGGLQGVGFDGGGDDAASDDEAFIPVPGVRFYCGDAYDAKASASSSLGVSDADGACTFTFERPGIYTVWTEGYVDDRGKVISSPAVATVHVVKPADYAAVDAVLAGVPADLSGYTPASVAAYKAALAQVDRGCNALAQADVDAAAAALAAAVAGLVPRADIGSAAVSVAGSGFAYSGRAITPAVSVTLGGRALEQGRDFTVSYAGNVRAGTATITVAGIGDYAGSAASTFAIAPARVTSVSLAKTQAAYTGKAAVLAVSAVKAGALSLGSGDYAVSYLREGKATTDLTSAGAITVRVTGKGNFAGSADATFTISKAAGAVAVKAKAAKASKALSAKASKKTTLAAKKYVKVTKKTGTLTYARASVKGPSAKATKAAKKKIKVAAKTGKITIAKGLARGTYTVKVKIACKASANYKASKAKTVTVKIKVK